MNNLYKPSWADRFIDWLKGLPIPEQSEFLLTIIMLIEVVLGGIFDPSRASYNHTEAR